MNRINHNKSQVDHAGQVVDQNTDCIADQEDPNHLSAKKIAILAGHAGDDDELTREIERLTATKREDILFDRFNSVIADYRKFNQKYSHIHQFSIADIDRKAKTECVLELILRSATNPAARDEYFHFLLKYVHHFDLEIPLKTPDAFRKYLNRIKDKGFPNALIHGGLNKTGNATKINKAMEKLLVLLAADRPHAVSAEYIKQDLDNILAANDHLVENKVLYDVSARAISDFLLKPIAINAMSFARDNINAFRKKVFGILRFAPPSKKLVRISLDGYVFQVVCEGDEGSGEPIQLVGIFIRDDKTKAILGIAIGETENHELMMEALREYFAIAKNRVPHEIVMDCHSSHLSKYLKNFIDTIKKDGVKVIVTKNPDRKGALERFFLTFQLKLLSLIFSYIGPGIRAKAPNAHPDRVFLLKVKSRSYLTNKEVMKSTLYSLVRKFYNTQYLDSRLTELPPMMEFTKGPSGHLKEYSDEMIAFMSYDHHKTTVEGCGIMIQIDKYLYLFKNRLLEIAEELNTKKVDAYISADKKIAYIFEKGTSKFLCTMDFVAIIPVTEMERTEDEKKFMKLYSADTRRLINLFGEKMLSRRDEIRELLNQDYTELTTRAKLKKQLDTEYSGYQMGFGNPQDNTDDPAWLNKTSRKRKLNRREKNLGLVFGDTI